MQDFQFAGGIVRDTLRVILMSIHIRINGVSEKNTVSPDKTVLKIFSDYVLLRNIAYVVRKVKGMNRGCAKLKVESAVKSSVRFFPAAPSEGDKKIRFFSEIGFDFCVTDDIVTGMDSYRNNFFGYWRWRG